MRPGNREQRLEDLVHELFWLRLCNLGVEEEHKIFHASAGDGQQVTLGEARAPPRVEVGSAFADGRLKLGDKPGRETA